MRHSYRASLLAFGLLFCMCGVSSDVVAQATTATVLGTVTDPSGAAVAGVTVTVINTSTGQTQSATTGSDGDYLVPLLPITGMYTVTVEAQGFKKFVRTGVVLNINQYARVDAPLVVGAVTQAVEVTGLAPQVNTTTSSLGESVEQKRITELPLNGRNPVQLAGLVAGVTTISAPPFMSQRSGSTLTVNGSRANENDFLLDGVHFENATINAGVNYPNPDALQEFKLITNTFSAEYGRNAGSVFDAVVKSGTNAIHGSAWDFLRNRDLNARNWFLPGTKPADLKQNQFGFTLGGPAIKNKWFWFGSYQGLRIHQEALTTSFVPTASERAGYFTTPLKDPNTGLPIVPDPQGRYFLDPATYDPVTVKVMNAVLPLPSGPDGRLDQLYASPTSVNQVLLKSDVHIGSNNVLSGTFHRDGTSHNFPYGSTVTGYSLTQSVIDSQVFSLTDTHTFKSNVLNQLRLSYFNSVDKAVPVDKQINAADWGVQGYVQDAEPVQSPVFIVGGWFNLVGTATFRETTLSKQLGDILTWIHGNHSFKMGVDIQRIGSVFLASQTPEFYFFGGKTGNALADFLLGTPDEFVRRTPVTSNKNSWEYAGFFQDDWKVARRLTLNLGLRYGVQIPFVVDSGHVATFRPGQQSTKFTTAPTGLVFVGDQGIPRGLYPTDKNNFEPRVGFAWDVRGNGKTAVRASYGVFHDLVNLIGAADQSEQNPPYRYVQTIFSPPGGVSNPWQGNPNPWPYTGFNSSNPTFYPPITVYSTNQNVRQPLIQSWTIDFQHELAQNLLVEASYVGKQSVGLYENVQANPSIYISGTDPATGQPYSTGSNIDARRIYAPNFSSIIDVQSGGRAHYNALELTTKYRGKSLLVTAAYTLSRAMDRGSNFENGTTWAADPLCLECDFGLSDFDRTHVFRASWVYTLPTFFKGQGFGGGVVRQVLGGWEVTGLTTLSSGAPFSVLSGVGNMLNGEFKDRAELVGDPNLSNSRPRGERVLEWFNTAAFALNPIGKDGNSARNFMRGPSFLNTDLGLMKNFPISERLGQLQFRAELFNAFNQVHFDPPVNNVSAGNFGQIVSAEDARIVQFALKYEF